MPRWANRSPSRCRNTSPRGLAISRIPIVNPSRRSGRGRRGRIVGLRSEVGSKSTVIYASLHPQPSFPRKREPRASRVERLLWAPACAGATRDLSASHLACHRKAAAGAADGPAADDAGEHPGIAAGADDHQPARTEFVDGLAGERGWAALGDALGAGDQLLAGDLAQLVEFFVEPRLRPAGLAEGALVLGADHQERVAGRRQLDAVDRLQRLGHAAPQPFARTRLPPAPPLQPDPPPPPPPPHP